MVPLKALIGGLAIAALTTLASTVAPSGAAATPYNYLANGSFENSSGFPDFNNFIGWTESGVLDHTFVASFPFYGYPGAEDGQNYVVAGPHGDGFLSQTFTDTDGQSLNISGWYNAFGDNNSDLSILFDGKSLFSATDPNTNGAWKNLSFNVTAMGSDTLTLSFRDDPGWIGLDNFSVTAGSASVLTNDAVVTPLPPTLPLFAGGLAMMGMIGWRRKRQAVAIALPGR
jgi:hypothetical protein